MLDCDCTLDTVDICSFIKDNPLSIVKITIKNDSKLYKCKDLHHIPWFVDNTMNYMNANNVKYIICDKQIEFCFSKVEWELKHFDLLIQFSEDRDMRGEGWVMSSYEIKKKFYGMIEPLAECDQFFGKNDLHKRIISLDSMKRLLMWGWSLCHTTTQQWNIVLSNTTNDRLRLAVAMNIKQDEHHELSIDLRDYADYGDNPVFIEWLDQGLYFFCPVFQFELCLFILAQKH